jgi:hypothetical protein
MCYAGGAHLDSGDLGYTVRMRAFRAAQEPKYAYQFVYPFMRHAESPFHFHGVIMSQPAGTITLWPAGEIAHGSSVDIRTDDQIPRDQKNSIGLALVQKKAMFTFCKNSNLNALFKIKSLSDYYRYRSAVCTRVADGDS